MIVVYIAGPFSAKTRDGVEENIAKAVQLGINVAKFGAFPIIPHANTAHPEFENIQPYEFWIEGTMKLLKQSDALITVTGWKNSKGAKAEVDWCIDNRKPVFHRLLSLAEWLPPLSPPDPNTRRP